MNLYDSQQIIDPSATIQIGLRGPGIQQDRNFQWSRDQASIYYDSAVGEESSWPQT